MLKDNNNSKLDDKIKQSLTNYKPKYNSEHWLKMETKLNALPISGNFKWNYFLNVFIGLGVIGGSYLLYTFFSSKAEVKTEISSPVVPATPVIKNAEPVIAPSNAVTTSAPSEVHPANPENLIKSTEILVPKEKRINETVSNKTLKEKSIIEEKPKGLKDTFTKPQQILLMGNEPIFGDMLDSSKGIIGETKEKEATKKAAIIHSDNKIGWDKFLSPNVKADSTTKNKEKIDKDSLKTPNE